MVPVRLVLLCKLQAEALTPRLMKAPGKSLCFVNIAGGPASDSINTLITLRKQNPSLLRERKIEIAVLDVDTFGPAFANQCIESLKKDGGGLHGLDLSFRHIPYDWSRPAPLAEFLSERREWVKLCSSEGGLFEYGSDEDIAQNLHTLYGDSEEELRITGSILHDLNTVDPGIHTAMQVASITARLIGTAGLKKIVEKTEWTIDRIDEANPRYVVFSLKKGGGRNGQETGRV